MIRRQAGFSVLDFVLAMGVVSAIVALGATFGMNTLRQGEQQTAFASAMTDVWQATERAIIDEWRLSGCRTLTAPPSLSSLVEHFEAPAYLLTLPYAISIDYRTATSVTVSGGVTLIVTLPEGMSGFSLKPVLTPLAQSVRVSERSVVLYYNIASIQSPLQHQYFDAETGCMQGDYS
ncbi:hypothetical protein A165_14280 [Vibrio tasmaniensis ZS-17]|uniref:hypothetical protein n=1 Tax=Vibrio tasmaniensis TaxID=212663 RepID=UPI0002D935B0|nr:hypothetical protein [Vibrio tasmaniensis]OED62719.1 hypothetical protein A165_14280 [Vibrio tasmaniensis ZS-17]